MNGALKVAGRPSLAATFSAGGPFAVVDPVPDLDPLLAEAFGLWRASAVTPGWVPADGWANEGTGGSSLDLIAASEAPVPEGANGESEDEAVDGNRVEPELVAGGFSIGFGLGNADNGGADYGFFTEGAFDWSGSFAVTLDFTPDNIGVDNMRYLRKGGPFGHVGLIIEEVVPGFGGFIMELLGENVSPPATGFVASSTAAVAGRQTLTLVLDRTAHLFRPYRNGELVAAPLSDETGMGDCTTALPLIVGPGQTVHNIVYHERALTAGEAADLHNLMGV